MTIEPSEAHGPVSPESGPDRLVISIFELGVSEAYEILTRAFGQQDLPPLEAIENEDWGRDLLLSRFLNLPRNALERAGIAIPDSGSETP